MVPLQLREHARNGGARRPWLSCRRSLWSRSSHFAPLLRRVQLLDLAALHDAPTLALLWQSLFYGEAGESRAQECCTTPLTFLTSPPVCSLSPSTCSAHTRL